MALANKVIYQAGAIREFEKPEVCEAIKVANANRWTVALSPTEWVEREARLKKEYEERSNAPVPGKEQQEEKIRIICCSASPKADFYHKHVLNEGNPALKEAASQFNDALLDEQAKKIEELTKDKELMKKATLSQLDDFIEIYNLLTKESQKTKRLGKEIARLNSIIHEKNEELKRKTKGCCELVTENVDLEKKLSDKDAVLSDVAEELRLSKIREKNLTEVCQKYMKENKELWATLADNVVDKIDAQALKSAESALAYKDSYIEKLKNKKVINNRVSMEAIAKYVDAVSKAELDGLVLVSWKNDGKEITSVYQLKNGKRYTLSLVYTGEEFLFYKTDLDKKPRIPISEESREDFIKKTIDNYNRIAANLGCVGSKGGNGIIDQMVGIDIAEEGADHSGATVIWGKDFVKKFKENEDFFHDLFEKKHKEIKEFMSAEAEQFFEGDGIPTKMEVMEPSRKFKKR